MAKEGKRQSPIDIETESVKEAWSVTTENPMVWEYTEKHCLNVENTGASWKVNVDGTGSSNITTYLVRLLEIIWLLSLDGAISTSITSGFGISILAIQN